MGTWSLQIDAETGWATTAFPRVLFHDLDEVLANAAIACDPADGADVNTRLRRVSSPRRRDEGLHRQRR